jgi:type IV pilus assembly protein PilQ
LGNSCDSENLIVTDTNDLETERLEKNFRERINMRRNKRQFEWLCVVLAAGFVFALCPAIAEEQAGNVEEEAVEKVELETTSDEIQPIVLSAVQQRMQKEISVDFRETEIDDVLRALAKQANVDIVKSPKVIGQVTATLTNIPLEEALDQILAAHGYGYISSENMIRVVPQSDILDIREKIISKVYRITYADVKEVEKSLGKFISQAGSISANVGTSNIIVSDTESKIEAIEKFLEEIDRRTPQILVEVRIYDLTNTDALDLGIAWGLDTAGSPTWTGNFTGGSNLAETTGNLAIGILEHGISLTPTITAELDDDEAKLLASPRLLVLDNETATFKSITEVPYQQLSQGGSGGGFGTTEFKEIGVELSVTPHVTADNLVRLHVIPIFSVQNGSATITNTQTSGNEIGSSIPKVDTRQADTIALVEDGQTVVIGGLKKLDVSKNDSGIPLLSDLPIIGGLFKSNSEKIVNSELVIFITPRIIHAPTLSPREREILQATEIPAPKDAQMTIEKHKNKS